VSGRAIFNKPLTRIIPALLVMLGLAFILSLAVGSSSAGLSDLLALSGGASSTAGGIILELRLPRALMALFAGIALASGGCVYQALLRNPLAEPYILGVSGGAAVGAIFGALVGLHSRPATVAMSFVFAMLAMIFVMRVARRRNYFLDSNILILAGVVLNTLFSALIVLFLSLIRDPQSQTVFFWLMGDLSSVTLAEAMAVAFPVLSVSAVLCLYGFRLNLIHLGEDAAKQAGITVEKDKWILFALASLAAALTVSFTGIIGFVGLLVPHAARRLFGADNRRLIPTAALCGGAFLLFCDTLARVVASPVELPTGVITAAFGVPFFLILLWRERNAP